MDPPDHVTKFLQKLMQDNFFILQNFFLETWKIKQKTMKNFCQLRLRENFVNNFTVNCHGR